MEVDEDPELQEALRLSLQDYNQSQQTQPESSTPGPSGTRPEQKTTGNKSSGNTAATNTAAAGGKRRRGKKLPQFAPSESEIEGCFKELASHGRSKISIRDIIETGSKLGLEIDAQKATSMLEYLQEERIGAGAVSHGGISLEDFKAIAAHFRIE